MKPVAKPVLNTAPTETPVSLAELKAFLRIDSVTEDTILTILLKTSVEKVEKLIARKLINQVWDIYFDFFPCTKRDAWWDGVRDGAISELYKAGNKLEMPFGPMSALASIKVYDEENVESTFDSANYYADIYSTPAKVTLKHGSMWPSTILRPSSGIKITGTFGMGADGAAIPHDIKMAILTLGALMYEHRGDELPEIPEQVTTLLIPYSEFRI